MTAPIENLDKHALLEKFQAKAGCMHTQDEAHRVWLRLKPHLTRQQQQHLSTAWGHHTFVGEGREELDMVCNEIRASWEKGT